jgi:hypothetical protein
MYELCPWWEWDDQNRFNINWKWCPNYENIKNKLNFINDYYWSSTQNSSSYLIETTGHTVLATYWHINFYSWYTNVNEDYYNIKHHAICIHN